MTQDQIIELARQAHRKLVTVDYPGHTGQLDPWTTQLVLNVVDLIRPQPRKWVGLSDDEYEDVLNSIPKELFSTRQLCYAIEAALKSKNGG